MRENSPAQRGEFLASFAASEFWLRSAVRCCRLGMGNLLAVGAFHMMVSCLRDVRFMGR